MTGVLADEGQAVELGQPLVRLDDTVLQAQLAEADQAVLTAQANLALAQAGPRPSQVDAARAALHQAQAVLDGAKQGQADAQRARDELQELDAQIHAAQSRVALADRQIEQAPRAMRWSAPYARALRAMAATRVRPSRRSMTSNRPRPPKPSQPPNKRLAARASASLSARCARNPVALDTRLRSAQGQARQAEAGVRLAQTALAVASARARPEAVALADAKLAQVEAARNGLRVQAAKVAITSPLAGTVTSRIADPGRWPHLARRC